MIFYPLRQRRGTFCIYRLKIFFEKGLTSSLLYGILFNRGTKVTKLLKVHDNVYEELTSIKREGETFSEVIYRLLALFALLQKVNKEATE